MTPTAPELLAGCVAALSSATAAEDGPRYLAGTLNLAVILNVLAAQECATGSAARVWENAAMRALFAERAADYDAALEGALAAAAAVGDGDASLAALDAANADLRRRLIRLDEAVEARGDADTRARILHLYGEMAARRLLHLPV